MPRKKKYIVHPDTTPDTDQWLEAQVIRVSEQSDEFEVELMLTEASFDYHTIKCQLPGPIRPSTRLGQLLEAAGYSVQVGEAVDIDHVKGPVKVRFREVHNQFIPIAFAALKELSDESQEHRPAIPDTDRQ